MVITIDATSLLLPSAGVKNYVHYWLRSLAAAASLRGDVVKTYPPGLKATGIINHRASRLSKGASLLSLVTAYLANDRHSPLLELLLSGADLFHCSQHVTRLPQRPRNTATIFDLSCWTRPEYHTAQNIYATRRYADQILKRCDRLIAISTHTRQDAFDILGIPLDRICVIHPGVPQVFFDATTSQAERVRAQYRLPPSYLLFVGCIEPRKNVRGLIRAYQELPEGLRHETPLVIAGPFGWEKKDLRSLLAKPHILYLGYVPESELPGLFRGAAALVYPSFYEGFGLPVAQAMAAGIPVITSNCSSLPEVVGDAGLTVDPNSTTELAGAMHRILTCPEVARDLGTRAQSRAGAYRWTTAAGASLDFFHDVLNDQ
jgi:glycosyltransferase involved in cell wall biosynthesis